MNTTLSPISNYTPAVVQNDSTGQPLRPTCLPDAVLGTLAQRLRSGGVMLLTLDPDGAVTFCDSSAGTFFHRYVVPMLQWGEVMPGQATLGQRVSRLDAAAGVCVWDFIPGVLLAAVSLDNKKQHQGAIVLAAKASSFNATEDVLRVCGRLGLDATWLTQQADQLPGYSEQALQRQTRLLTGMVHDRVKIDGLETEIVSLSGQLANTYEELSLIYQISSGMRINRRAADFFKQTCLDVLEVMGVAGMGVALHAENFHRQEPVIYGPLGLPPGVIHRLSEQLMTELNERKSVLLINDLANHKQYGWLGAFATTLIAVPLQRQEQVLGCLFGLNKNTGEFDSVDSKLLNSIANESAIYIENAMLFDDVHGLMMGLLHSLTSAVDAKDAYTCGHSERVALLSRHLAQEAGLNDHQVERVYMAGLLHDVGKIGVPETVLQKTGRLTAEEFELMKKHPEVGARILRDIKQIADIIPGVLHHHERFDGKGYPSALAGYDIPIMGRIICLADCFDAMTSNRTYRKALPLEVALTEIRRCSGTQFDPALTEAFLRIGVDRLRDLLTVHQEQSKRLIDLQQLIRGA